ncbi:MAG: prepilin peptidase [Bacteriovoracaceae bacterium]|nr:prepilin peptidase [Bacteriovoracaceae bacterium]
MEELYRIYAGVLGLLIGSFLNVVIHRLPRNTDMVVSRSACPKCSAPIPWWLNIPLVSWIYLRGKCKNCSAPISWRYPAVELAMGLIMFLAFPQLLSPELLFRWIFISAISGALICHFFIDLEHKILPDSINIYLLCLILPYEIMFNSPMHWLAGGAFGFLGPLAVSWGFYKWKGKVGLGGGDIKLWGVLGVYLGPFGIMENIFFSCFLGSIVGIILILAKRYDREGGIPFGPFIIVVSFVQLFNPGLLSSLGINIF